MVNDSKVVLLVEDLPSDMELMRIAFKRAKLDHPIHEAQDGQEAIEYLSGAGIYADRKRFPEACVVITDLKMPRVDGFELLKWLMEHEQFAALPRIVLSASDHESDRRRAAELGCCEYLIKPAGFDQLVNIVLHVDETWILQHCSTAGRTRTRH